MQVEGGWRTAGPRQAPEAEPAGGVHRVRGKLWVTQKQLHVPITLLQTPGESSTEGEDTANVYCAHLATSQETDTL